MHAARLHRQLEAREQAQERFTEQVITAQETERRRLAADIHDGISQRLVSLAYHLDAAQRALPDHPADAAVQVRLARDLADLSMDEARTAITGLRPPVLDDLGLAGALSSLSRSVPGVVVVLDLADRRLPEPRELALYRMSYRRRCRTSSSMPTPRPSGSVSRSARTPPGSNSTMTATGSNPAARRTGTACTAWPSARNWSAEPSRCGRASVAVRPSRSRCPTATTADPRVRFGRMRRPHPALPTMRLRFARRRLQAGRNGSWRLGMAATAPAGQALLERDRRGALVASLGLPPRSVTCVTCASPEQPGPHCRWFTQGPTIPAARGCA